MADIPNRLPAPEKRKEKINKNDMRYLYRIDKANQRSKRRAVIDTEIECEQKAAAKKRRQSVTNAKQVAREANKRTEERRQNRQNLTDEQLLLAAARDVCMGNREVPCFFGALSGQGAESAESIEDLVGNASTSPRLKQAVEILEYDPKAVVWHDLDYGHFIPHANLWIFCASCHAGMRSTNIGKIDYFPSVVHGAPPDASSRSGNSLFNTAPSHRWLFYHHNCESRK